MSIKFYSMPGCGYCKKASELLKKEIESGEVIVIESNKAPKEVSGFPYFEYNGKTHTGYPGTKEKLNEKLGFTKTKENYSIRGGSADGPKWPYCQKYSGFSGGVYPPAPIVEDYPGELITPKAYWGIL